MPIIKTRKLILRDIRLEDITEEYISWLNNPEINKFLEIRFTPQTKQKIIEYVEAKLKNTVNTKHFGIYDQDGKRLVGTVTLPHIDQHHQFADISFVIGHSDAGGKGYATEAVHGVCYYMFKFCGLNKLIGGYYSDHIASARVFEKNRFEIEGRLRGKCLNYKNQRVDHIVVGMLADDFMPDEQYIGKLS